MVGFENYLTQERVQDPYSEIKGQGHSLVLTFVQSVVKPFHIWPITLYCVVGFHNYNHDLTVYAKISVLRARTSLLSQMSICVSLFGLHGPSVVSPILLYYTGLPLWT